MMNNFLNLAQNLKGKKPWQLFAFFLTLILLFHANFLFPDKTISPDAHFILGSIEKFSTPFEYLWNLLQLKGIDFQPLRDLSLYIDLKFFRLTGINVSIFFNCVLWAGACYHLAKIYEENVELIDLFSLIMFACLALHPVVSQSINWTMARKHILAIYFILLATRYFLNQKSFSIYYLLSLLATPVALLWPLWALSVSGVKSTSDFIQSLRKLALSFFFMMLIGILNYAYYFHAKSFQAVYGVKPIKIEVPDLFLHVSKHFYQIFFPLKLTFSYQLNPYDLLGFIIPLVIAIYLWKKRSLHECKWLTLGLIPLPLFLRTPATFYDTYLLLPLLGIIIFLAQLKPRKKFYTVVAFCFLLAFSIATLANNKLWGNPLKFHENNFVFSRSCTSARQFALHRYLKLKSLPQDAYDYIENNSCLIDSAGLDPITRLLIVHIESLKYLVEDDIDLEFRKTKLLEMGTNNYYPLLMYAVLMTKQNDNLEVERISGILNEKIQPISFMLDYDEVYAEILPKYCREMNLENCLRLTKRFSPQVHEPYL